MHSYFSECCVVKSGDVGVDSSADATPHAEARADILLVE